MDYGHQPCRVAPGQPRGVSGAGAAPLVMVSEVMNDTDTSRFAHIRFPALGWEKKDGTVTNSERRISRQRAFLPAPGGWRRTGGSSRRWRNGWATARPLPGNIRTRFFANMRR